METKGQIWSLDFIIAIVILTGGLFTFYFYSTNLLNIHNDELSNLKVDAQMISESLVTGGSPLNWTSSNVNLIGITDGDTRIDQFKVQEFSVMDYEETKRILAVSKDYQVSFVDENGQSVGLPEVGGNYSVGEKNIISITRLLFYDGKIVKMVIRTW